MSDRVDKKALIGRVAKRLERPRKEVEPIVEASLEEMYEAIKEGYPLSLRNFGTFYVRPGSRSWVFRFNPAQRLRAVFGWSSTYKGEL